jgi:hypothetical protein
MDDIFKSKDEMEREEKINNLFKSAGETKDIKKEAPEMVPVEELNTTAEPGGKNSKVFLGVLVFLLFAGLLSVAGYLFWQSRKIAAVSQPAPVADEADAVAEKVRALTELPEGKPALVTVTDREKFSGQSFFASALDGDEVLLYVKAKKVILYRPSSNEVISTGTLFSESAAETAARLAAASSVQDTPKSSEKIENKVKVDILNGTEIKGLAKETASKLSGMENVELAKVGNAQKSDYTKIIVIDLSGKNETATKIIAQKLSGEIGELPTGESKGTADILVIAGK